MNETTTWNIDIQTALIEWFDRSARTLPWRSYSNPYAIWLSEVILQQTRVAHGRAYWEKFMTEFPTLQSLAEAPSEKVMGLWAGLGYYSRARNLHATAKIIAELGDFPNNAKDLQSLPGIGPYTAAAIASIAFKQVIPALDGNAFRVYTRLFALADCIDLPSTQKIIAHKSLPLLDPLRPGDSNQAIMDLGAQICTPTQPKCIDCPLAFACEAFRRGTQTDFPMKKSKKVAKQVSMTLHVIMRKDKIAVIKRPSKGIWGDLWCFPEELPETIPVIEGLRKRHLLTHLDLDVHFPESHAPSLWIEPQWEWVDPNVLQHRAIPVPIRWWLEEKNYI